MGTPRPLAISPATYRRICSGALWALGAIVVTGAAVRLSGSGLGCSDWPTCEHNRFVAPWERHAMVEFVNRTITGLVSLAVILAVLGSRYRTPRRRDLTRWSWFLVIGVVAQIVIGAFVTLSGLRYTVVALHFLVSMVLVWAAVVLCDRADRPDDAVVVAGPRRNEGAVLAALASLVLLTGSVVTSAGPHPGTNGTPNQVAKRLPLDLSWAARVHSASVWLLVAAVVVIAVRSARLGDAAVRKDATTLVGVAAAQGAIGYVQYFTGVPAVLVGFHMAGATLTFVVAVRTALRLWSVADPDHPAATHPDGELARR